MNIILNPNLTQHESRWPLVIPTHRLHLQPLRHIRQMLMPEGKLRTELSREAWWHLRDDLPDHDREWLDSRFEWARGPQHRYDFVAGAFEQRSAEDLNLYDNATCESMTFVEDGKFIHLMFRRCLSFQFALLPEGMGFHWEGQPKRHVFKDGQWVQEDVAPPEGDFAKPNPNYK
jgi:hypothetical protein